MVHFTPSDEGKRVVTPEGTVLGAVEQIRDGVAYVRPRPGLLHGRGRWLDGTDPAAEAFPLRPGAVASVSETAVHLSSVASTSEPPIRR